MLADQEGLSVDEDAPWDNAVLLAAFGPDEDEAGSDKRRRSATTTDLAERDGLDYGLKLYCVDCGFQGTATATGSLGINWLKADVYNAEVKLSGQLYAGMFLGLEMFVEYQKTWEKDFARAYLNPWEIPAILEFGPYIRVGVEATIDIKAEGTLLLGASATWGGFEATMDFLHPEKSTATGLDPTIDRKAEAEVEISAEATLGLPVGIGIGVTVFSTWSVDVELTDTPALVADATFKASANANDCTGPNCEAPEEGDHECDGGIAWSIGFRNTLSVSVTDFDPYEINVWNSDPIADGCINLLGGNSTDPDGNNGDPTNPTNGGGTPAACTPGDIVPTTSRPQGTYCSFKAGRPTDSGQQIGKAIRGGDITACAAKCLDDSRCASFGFNQDKGLCRKYSSTVVDLKIVRAQRSNKIYNDVGCYQVCPS